MIEGKPATGGRLTLTPVGGGPRAFSAIDNDGRFLLRSSNGATGAFPGSYRVFFQQPLDSATKTSVMRELRGEVSADELTVIYRGPRGNALVIPESGDESLTIDIRTKQGWSRHVTE
jgi:hypothetical protein